MKETDTWPCATHIQRKWTMEQLAASRKHLRWEEPDSTVVHPQTKLNKILKTSACLWAPVKLKFTFISAQTVMPVMVWRLWIQSKDDVMRNELPVFGDHIYRGLQRTRSFIEKPSEAAMSLWWTTKVTEGPVRKVDSYLGIQINNLGFLYFSVPQFSYL